MAISRTAKGTASSKTNGTALVLSGVALDAGSTLVVGVGFASNTQVPSSVKWGGRDLKYVVGSGVTQGDSRVRLYKANIHRNRTRDITITWPTALDARVMFASQINEASAKDVQNTNTNTASTAPGTGAAQTSTVADTISIAAFLSLGPGSDTPGTAGLGHTLGQRVGTVGVPPVSNVTIQETYEILAATGDVRATLSGATARDWANTIVAFAPSQTYTVVDAAERLWVADNDSNQVIIRLESQTTGDFVEVRIAPDEFDDLTDLEVEDRIRAACQWHNDHRILDELEAPVADTTRNTRLATFVNDTVAV